MDSSVNIADLREEYSHSELSESDVDKDPVLQFNQWMSQALEAGVEQPNAMTLATVSSNGRPSARIVLLKSVDEHGFVFFTNYKSRKSLDLEENTNAALVFWWLPLSRQVRVEGRVRRVDEASSDRYFRSRPRGSQIGAWVSDQSETVASRSVMERAFKEVEQTYEGKEVPRPDYWGGFTLEPDRVEFWQGRPDRLHDRIRYRREAGATWIIERLYP